MTQETTGQERLTLKWGTVKGWEITTDATRDALQKWADIDGVSMSAMAQGRTDAHTEALCEVIDAVDGVIWNDWDGVEMTKDEAKKYVREYRK